MRCCRQCGHSRAYHWTDGRFHCRICGCQYTWTIAWAASRLSAATKRRLLEPFILVVPVSRQRLTGAPTNERFSRLIRACFAHVEELRESSEGAIECDETTIDWARRGKRDWGAAGMVIVWEILQRNGQGKGFAVPDRKGNRIVGPVRGQPRPGSLYCTDDWHADGSLRVRRGAANGIRDFEDFWDDRR